MNTILPCHDPAGLTQFAPVPGWPPLGPADWRRTAPDRHWLLVGRNDEILARCSAWWSSLAPWPGQRQAYLGHFATTAPEAGSELLRHVLAKLAGHGVTLAIAPIDGSTWEPYRFVIESDGSPPFSLEPRHPPQWPECFTGSGFTPWACYRSARWDMATTGRYVAEGLEARILSRDGIRLRPLDASRLRQELLTLHRLSCRCFARNPLFSPGDPQAFIGRYAPWSVSFCPDLLWFAERQGEAVGFVFCLPDRAADGDDSSCDTLIVKTIAVVEQPACRGLSLPLMQHALAAARQRGFRRAILALMHEGSLSSRMAVKRMGARVFRRYALFAKTLA
jgi:GNAT superfamily N-acetyltransferase